MSFNTTNIPARLAQTLIIDTSATAGSQAQDNIFSGVTLANKVYSIRLDNTNIASPSYFKVQFATSYSDQNEPATVLFVAANSTAEYVFPEGYPSGGFSTGFSFIGTSTTTQTGTQTDPSGNGSFKVTILAGT